MIRFSSKGDFKKTIKYLNKVQKFDTTILQKYAQEGVDALSRATPQDTGLTSKSWSYEIEKKNDSIAIVWKNSHVVSGVPIAVILQYGHGTRNGGYVQGRDYINPTMRPIFDKIADAAWREVSKS